MCKILWNYDESSWCNRALSIPEYGLALMHPCPWGLVLTYVLPCRVLMRNKLLWNYCVLTYALSICVMMRYKLLWNYCICVLTYALPYCLLMRHKLLWNYLCIDVYHSYCEPMMSHCVKIMPVNELMWWVNYSWWVYIAVYEYQKKIIIVISKVM